MKSVFSVGGDGEFPQPSYEISIQFNGVPDTVVIEINRTVFEGYPSVSKQECVMRAPLKANHARAIASALLSAATEVRA